MKKYFFSISLLISVILLSCTNVFKDQTESTDSGNVIVTINKNNARTISPANDSSFTNVTSWKISFVDTSGNGYDTIEKKLTISEDVSTLTETLPVGTFDVIAESIQSESETIPYYGKSSITITGKETSPVSATIFVSPKKLNKGSFSYNLTLTGDTISNLSAKLTSSSDSTTSTLTSEETTSENGKTYKLSATDIPSGFYTLSVEVTKKGSSESEEIFDKYFDSLVEIIDGITTTGSKSITFTSETSKTYYATPFEGKATGNGIFASKPALLNTVLGYNPTVKNIEIIMLDISGSSDVEIDASLLQKNITYSIKKDPSTSLYTITKNSDKELDIHLSDSIIKLKDSSDNNSTANISCSDSSRELNFILNGGINVCYAYGADSSGGNTALPKSVSIDTESVTYYYSNPAIIFKYSAENELSDLIMSLPETLSDYMFVSKTSQADSIYTKEYLIIPTATGNVSINSGSIPSFDIQISRSSETITSETIYAGDALTFSAAVLEGEDAFPDDVTFSWYINGESLPTESITIGDESDTYTAKDNTIICVAYSESKNEYKSKTRSFSVADRTALLFTSFRSTNTSTNLTPAVGYAILNSDNTLGTSTSMTAESDTNFSTYIDAVNDSDSNTIYYLIQNSNGSYFIGEFNHTEAPTKYYSLSSDASDETTSYTYTKIKKGLNGTLYVLSQVRNICTILSVELLSDSNTATATPTQVLQYTTLTLDTDSTEFLDTDSTEFCVDSDSSIYFVLSEQDSNARTTSIKIQKYSNSTTSDFSSLLSQDNETMSGILSDKITDISKVSFTDMYCKNGDIYLLYSYANLPSSGTGYNSEKNFFKGGVIVITSSGSSVITLDENYAPQKIIAIKPKELLIAVDGFEINSSSTTNKNKLATFDLLKQSLITRYLSGSDYDFNYAFDGSGNSGSFFYDTKKKITI